MAAKQEEVYEYCDCRAVMTVWFVNTRRSVRITGCRAKVFTQMEGDMKDRLGKPDLMVLFTNTVSHKMIITAINEAKRNNTEIVRSHSSSGSALEEILNQYCG